MEQGPFKGKIGLTRLLNAVGYSIKGFQSAFRHEEAFRQEVLLAAVLIPVALWAPASNPGRALMIASVMTKANITCRAFEGATGVLTAGWGNTPVELARRRGAVNAAGQPPRFSARIGSTIAAMSFSPWPALTAR